MTREEAEKLAIKALLERRPATDAVTDLILRLCDEQWNAALDAAAKRGVGQRILTAEISSYNKGYSDACRDSREDILGLKREVTR